MEAKAAVATVQDMDHLPEAPEHIMVVAVVQVVILIQVQAALDIKALLL